MPDPISTRIDTYQADLAQLETNFAAARAALHSEFKADIAALVHNGNWQLYPEQEVARMVEQGLRAVIGKGMERHAR